jgi:cell division protein FtsB
MEEESLQKTNGSSAQSPRDEPRKEEAPTKIPPEEGRSAQKGLGWTVWVLVILIGFLLVSSIANLVVSQRAYESSRKQVKAIEQLTQSIKDIQRSIFNLSKMLEQAPQEEEEPEDEGGLPSGDGSI